MRDESEEEGGHFRRMDRPVVPWCGRVSGKRSRGNAEDLRDGTYPYTKTFFMVTRQAPSPTAERFIRFIRSPEGKAILSRVGHVPLQ